MATQPKPYISLKEYFELERASVDRHEYLNGQVFAMAGGTAAHSIISLNITGELRGQLRGRDCTAYNGDMRIRTSPSGLYTYADAVVACGDSQVEQDTLVNPVVIVEVLSKRTENYDRGKKFARYRRIPSFREYLLVAQTSVYVEHHIREYGSRPVWTMTEYSDLQDTIYLSTIDVALRLTDVYEKVFFPAKKKKEITNELR